MSRRKNKDFSSLVFFILVIGILLQLLEFISHNLWILIIPIFVIAIIIYANHRRKIELIRNFQTIESLLEHYKRDPYGFEHYVANLYELLGYKTEVTKPTNDGGKDIIMWKNGEKTVVEVKLHSKNNTIGRPMIQKLHSAMIDCDADAAFFVTTCDFTEPAIRYADKFNIKTVSGLELSKLINTINKNCNES